MRFVANIVDQVVQLTTGNHIIYLSPQESMQLGRDLIKLSMMAAREQLEQLEKDKEELILIAYADLSIDKIELDEEFENETGNKINQEEKLKKLKNLMLP